MSHKVGIISDAHGNVDALSKCIKFLKSKKVNKVFFLGDGVGYMPYGAGVAKLLMHHEITSIMGNHEAMLLGRISYTPEQGEIYRFGNQLSEIPLDWIKQIEKNGHRHIVNLFGKKIIFTHGTPRDPLLGYGRTASEIYNPEADVIFTGHTHRPHIFEEKSTMLINPGSCGMPRDNGSLLSLAIVDFGTMQPNIYRIKYSFSPHLKSKVHPVVLECFKREDNV